MPLLRPEATQYSQSAARQTIERYEPSLYESFATGFGEGLQYTSFGMAGRMTQWYRAGIDSEPIQEDAWKESKHFREGLKYFTGMTQDHAALLAYRHDIQAHRDFVRQHQKGFLSKATGFMGSLAGNIPDPINYIPYVRGAASLYLIGRGIKTAEQIAAAGKIARTAARLSSAKWTGPIGKSAAVSSAEAVAGTAVLQPLFIAEGRQSQIEYNYVNVLEQLGFAGVIGAGFGGLSSILKHVPAEVHEKGFVKTLDDVTAESPRTPDVAPVIKQEIEDAVTKIETRIDELKSQKATKESIVKQIEELKIQKLETEFFITKKQSEAEKPVITREEAIKLIKKDVAEEIKGEKIFKKDTEGYITDVKITKSSIPEYYKGSLRKEIKNIIKKIETGKPLTEKQTAKIEALIEGKVKQVEQEAFYSGQPEKQPVPIGELKLQKGDKFSVEGEQFQVLDVTPEGKIRISDSITQEMSEIDLIPSPDTGTVVKVSAPELKGIDAKIAELEKTLEGITKAETAPGIPKPPSTETGIDKAASAIPEKLEIALDYSKAEPEKPLEIPPPPKESAVKGMDDINEQIESLKTDMQDLESRDLLTAENKQALADADKAVKDVALWKKAIRMAKDCIMGEPD